MNKFFKPKSKFDIYVDFKNKYQISEKELDNFLHYMSKISSMTVHWLIATFIWIVSISWIIQSIIALVRDFFWLPIKKGIDSMFGFINVFWVILWFAIPVIIIILGINYMINRYEYF